MSEKDSINHHTNSNSNTIDRDLKPEDVPEAVNKVRTFPHKYFLIAEWMAG